MTEKTLAELANDLSRIDIAMLATKSADGSISSRPMSNNGDVEFDGDSYYFTRDTSRMVAEIERDHNVSLAFSTEPGLLTGAGLFIAIDGEAEVVREKSEFERHWAADLESWFEQGVDTPGLVMLKVSARRIKYWAGEDEGEVVL